MEAARMIREGVVTSVELVQACLARVREVDGQALPQNTPIKNSYNGNTY